MTIEKELTIKGASPLDADFVLVRLLAVLISFNNINNSQGAVN